MPLLNNLCSNSLHPYPPHNYLVPIPSITYPPRLSVTSLPSLPIMISDELRPSKSSRHSPSPRRSSRRPTRSRRRPTPTLSSASAYSSESYSSSSRSPSPRRRRVRSRRRDSHTPSPPRRRGRRGRSPSSSRSRSPSSRSHSRSRSPRSSASPRRDRRAYVARRRRHTARSPTPSLSPSPPPPPSRRGRMMETSPRRPSYRRPRSPGRRGPHSHTRSGSPRAQAPTVLVSQIAPRVRAADLGELFSRAGRVRDIRLVLDRQTGRHKGAGYVEFFDREALPAAVRLSGATLCGHPVEVRAWDARDRDGDEGRRGGGAPSAPPVAVGWRRRNPIRSVNDIGDGVEDVPKLVSIEELKRLLNPRGLAPMAPVAQATTTPNAGTDSTTPSGLGGETIRKARDRVPLPLAAGAQAATRVYAGPFARGGDGNVEGVRKAFATFGDVVWVEVESGAGGVATVEFGGSEGARRALAAGDVKVDGTQVHIGAKRADVGADVRAELDGGGDGGVGLNASRRAMLMQQLARGEGVGARRPGDVHRLATVATESRALMLTNMFDPAVESAGFEEDVGEDVREECTTQYGTVAHVYVEKESHGIVYVRFAQLEAADKARRALDGRWFGGKKISAGFVSDEAYLTRFPGAGGHGRFPL